MESSTNVGQELTVTLLKNENISETEIEVNDEIVKASVSERKNALLELGFSEISLIDIDNKDGEREVLIQIVENKTKNYEIAETGIKKICMISEVSSENVTQNDNKLGKGIMDKKYKIGNKAILFSSALFLLALVALPVRDFLLSIIITGVCGLLLFLIDFCRIVIISGINLLLVITNFLNSLISGNIFGYLLGGLSDLINLVILSVLELVHFTLAILFKLSTKPIVPVSSSVPSKDVSEESLGNAGISDNLNWPLLIVIAMLILLLQVISFIIKKKGSSKVKREKETLYFISQDGNWNLGGSKRRVLP